MKSKEKRKAVDLDEQRTEPDQSIDNFSSHFSFSHQNLLEDDNFKFGRKLTKNVDFPTLKTVACSSLSFGRCFGETIGDFADLKQLLKANLTFCNDSRKIARGNSTGNFSSLQNDLFHVLNQYRDLYFPCQNLSNADECRLVACLHVLNHVLKSRGVVLKNSAASKKPKFERKDEKSAQIKKIQRVNLDGDDEEIEAKFKDQGFARSRVLFLTPFRHGALKIVDAMAGLLFGSAGSKGLVTNRKRFETEFGYDVGEDDEEKQKPRFRRPKDFEQIFAGNTDDCFRLNISVAKKSLKLYVANDHCDVIVASPLGIRTATGNDDQKEFDADFLSSIEIVVCELTDIFLMQNWSHVLHVFQYLNQRPKKLASVQADLSRIRDYVLNDKSKFYRQTAVFSRVDAPEIRAIFSKFCQNFDGLAMACNFSTPQPAICQINAVVSQAFHRFESSSVQDDAECRFDFFCRQILPDIKMSPLASRLLIFVPSYFDFVRLRNLLKSTEYSTDLPVVQVCEYSDTDKVSRARDLFFHGKKRVMLYTERYHFYKRYAIRGVRHVIFYQLPLYAPFYADVCDWTEWSEEDTRRVTASGEILTDTSGSRNSRRRRKAQDSSDEEDAIQDTEEDTQNIGEPKNLPPPTCTVLFSKYDALRLSTVVGPEKASLLLTSGQAVNVFEAKS